LPQNGDNCSSPIWPGPELIYAEEAKKKLVKKKKKMEMERNGGQKSSEFPQQHTDTKP